MKVFIFLLIVFNVNSFANSEKSDCANSTYEIVTINKDGLKFTNKYQIFVFDKGKVKNDKPLYETEVGSWFSAVCFKNKENSFIVFKDTCTVSSCIEDVYGIIDAKTKKLLLKPVKLNVSNALEAKKILNTKDLPEFPE